VVKCNVAAFVTSVVVTFCGDVYRAHAKAVDKLLTADGWNRLPTDGASRWIKIVAKELQDARFEKALSKVFGTSTSEPKTK
jgi:hypothetical protein